MPLSAHLLGPPLSTHHAPSPLQIGVFISRSSGMLFTPSLRVLWLLPVLQCLLFTFFTIDAISHFRYDYGLCAPAVVVGLLGGGVYVHGFKLLSQGECAAASYRRAAWPATSGAAFLT